jgi:predicted Zn-dependent peptidase
MLGSGRASRLYAHLVREQRIAQDASVFVFPIVGGAAMFTLWVTARPGVALEALEAATLAEIDQLAADGPRDEELERVRNLHSARAAGALERIGERADRLSMYACLFDDPDRVNVESARYEAVDASRVRAALATSITLENRVTLTYLPAGVAE